MKKSYKHYTVLTSNRLWVIKDSIKQEHKTPHYVSRHWLVESLSQCVCYLESIGCLESIPTVKLPDEPVGRRIAERIKEMKP